MGAHASHVDTEPLQETAAEAAEHAPLTELANPLAHTRPLLSAARVPRVAKGQGKKTAEKAATPVLKVAPKAKATRKAQIQALVDADEKENEAPGLFIQGTLTGPPLSLVASNVFKYCL